MTDPAYLPMTPEERMSRLIEECGEVLQAIGKLQRFGPDNHHPRDEGKRTNRDRLLDELQDLRQAIVGVANDLRQVRARDLDSMLRVASTVEMTPAEKEEQRRDFAHGNVRLHNPSLTREVVDRAAEALELDPDLERRLDGIVARPLDERPRRSLTVLTADVEALAAAARALIAALPKCEHGWGSGCSADARRKDSNGRWWCAQHQEPNGPVPHWYAPWNLELEALREALIPAQPAAPVAASTGRHDEPPPAHVAARALSEAVEERIADVEQRRRDAPPAPVAACGERCSSTASDGTACTLPDGHAGLHSDGGDCGWWDDRRKCSGTGARGLWCSYCGEEGHSMAEHDAYLAGGR